MVTIVEEDSPSCDCEAAKIDPEGGDGFETASDSDDQGADFEDALTEDEQRERVIAQANATRATGNAEYAQGKFRDALSTYAAALELLADHQADARAMCLCNRAMCYLQLGEYEESIHESSKALELDPKYVKALFRRAQAHEKLDKLEDALIDLKKVVELEPGNKEARKSVDRLQPIVTERQEKLKEEMLGKLKDLGNSILGRFGMSVDNFKADKDPETGSYSVSYKQ